MAGAFTLSKKGIDPAKDITLIKISILLILPVHLLQVLGIMCSCLSRRPLSSNEKTGEL